MEKILIFRHLSPQERSDISARQARGALVYLLPGFVTEMEVEHELIKESLIRDAVIDLINLIKETGDKELVIQRTNVVAVTSKKSLSLLLTVDRVSLWHYQRFRVYFLLRQEWIINHCIQSYSNDGQALTCYVPVKFSLWPECSGENIRLVAGSCLESQPKKRLNVKALFNYLLFFKLRILISLFRKVSIKDKKSIIIDRSIRQQCRNLITLEKKWDNFNLYPLFDLNPPDQLIISEVETPKLRSSNPFPLHSYFFNGEGRKHKTIYGEWILLKGMLSLQLYKEHRKLLKSFDNISRSLIHANKDTTEYSSSFSAKELLILRTFHSLRRSSSFYLLKFLCYRKYFNRYNFQIIAAIDENSPATRSILDAGKACGLKTIGIQHGNIGDSQPAYLYTDKDKSANIMTDITITWGNYWSNFLIEKANYPPESIKTAGQMRSDLIPVMQKNSGIFRKEISDSSFIVTFASQPIPDSNYRYKLALDVFSCFSSLPDAKLIVKLHPAERNAVSYYNLIAKEAGYPDPDIRYDIDLYELLAASDLVITAYSTVGSEAIYFGKPLIIYDPFREDLLKYVSEGVAFQATDSSSLNMLVEQLINGTLAPDKERYTQFIDKYALAIDGEATKRTLQYLQ
jgi:hypothetical protein